MSYVDRQPDPEDIFADTRMSFGDHIEELRTHLWRAIAGFIVCLFVSLFFGRPVLQFIAAPVEKELDGFYQRRVERIRKDLEGDDEAMKRLNEQKEIVVEMHVPTLAKALGIEPPPAAPEWVEVPERLRPLNNSLATAEAMRMISKPAQLATMGIMEGFMAYFKVSAVCGVVIGSPWIFYQLWAFVASGLYPHERRYVYVYLPFSLGLFLVGVFMCQFVVIPAAIHYLLGFNEWIGLEPDLRLNEWLSFAIMTPLMFGIAFQTPLVMLFLSKLGLVTSKTYLSYWRFACMIILVIAVLLTPSPDLITYCSLWLPMFGLYMLGILLAWWSERRSGSDLEIPEPEEMVEV
jgi:sec-independent protein translocase protein TatC